MPFIWFLLILLSKNILSEEERSKNGYPKGFLSDCPGSEKPATIPNNLLKHIFFLVQARTTTGIRYQRKYNYFQAPISIPKDPFIDFSKRKTILFINGYLDNAYSPITQVVGGHYVNLGYNVLLLDHNRFSTYIFPVAARITRDVGKRVAEVLAKMIKYGLDPKRFELLGISLGGQTVSFVGKYFQELTGLKLNRITSLDPSGACFRFLPPNLRLNASDAENVDVVHTNIDGYGMATPMGHVDFYVNGGEYQINEFLYELPCDSLCSHIKAYVLWYTAMQQPNVFIAMKCDSVQEARDANCYDNTPMITNLLGPKTNFSRPGIFYLATNVSYPYYLGRKGLKRDNDPSFLTSIFNDGDVKFT